MARFRNSNRNAETEMTYVSRLQRRPKDKRHRATAYFQRIGFDVAMI